MIDRNKLNRIKGVLSARAGAEIPKFTPGGPVKPQFYIQDGKFFLDGQEVTKDKFFKDKRVQQSQSKMVSDVFDKNESNSSINTSVQESNLPSKNWDPNNAEFKEFTTQAGINWNPINYDSFYKLKTANPNASIEQLVTNYESGKDIKSEIPGAPDVSPTTAVENAAEQAEKVENQKEQTVAEIKGNSDPQVKATVESIPDATKPLSPNDGPKIPIPEPAAVPEKLEKIDVSAGIQTGETQEDYNRRKQKEQTEADKKKQEAIYNGIGQAATQGLNMAGAYFGAQQAATDSNLTKGADALYDTAAETVKKLGPVGQVVGTAMGFAGTAGDIIQGLGGGTDQMTTTDKWMDSSFFSWNIGMLNGFGGKRSDAFAADQDILASVGSSYGGTTEDINNAATKASKKYGLFSNSARKRANRQIAEARSKQNLMGDISDEATDQRLNVQSMGEQAGLAYSLMTDGGYSQKYTYAAKQGGLLEWNPVIELEWQPQIELNWELPAFKEGGLINEELEWVPEFKEGGKTEELDVPEIEETTQKNVIPEGALHKNKHHMEHAEGLTKKGIPVIDEDGEQQAEIEHSEIIFTLEVTKKLEEYYDIFYSEDASNKEKDQAALDAGKLLVYQILENTEDRTGLIESCKKGGTLSLKKSTDDLIEEVLEWMPTVVVVEEFKEEPKKKSEKEQMKEAIKEVLIELLTK